jgi:hypothetical protein
MWLYVVVARRRTNRMNIQGKMINTIRSIGYIRGEGGVRQSRS